MWASCFCQRSLNLGETWKKNRSEQTSKLWTTYQVCVWIKKKNQFQFPINWSRETGSLLFLLNTSRPKFFLVFIKPVQSCTIYPFRLDWPFCLWSELVTVISWAGMKSDGCWQWHKISRTQTDVNAKVQIVLY